MKISIDELDAKAKAATPGMWAHISGHFEGHEWFKIRSRSLREKHGMTADDANFAAAVSPDVVRALIKVVRIYEEALSSIVKGPCCLVCECHACNAKDALSHARNILDGSGGE